MRRDFTYIDDVVEAIVRLIDRAPQGNPDWSGDKPDPGSSAAPWRVYNIGNNNPADVPKVVAILEKELGRIAQKELLPMQSGDVPATYADVESPGARMSMIACARLAFVPRHQSKMASAVSSPGFVNTTRFNGRSAGLDTKGRQVARHRAKSQFPHAHRLKSMLARPARR